VARSALVGGDQSTEKHDRKRQTNELESQHRPSPVILPLLLIGRSTTGFGSKSRKFVPA